MAETMRQVDTVGYESREETPNPVWCVRRSFLVVVVRPLSEKIPENKESIDFSELQCNLSKQKTEAEGLCMPC